MRCSSCSSENQRDAAFCTECGTSLTAAMGRTINLLEEPRDSTFDFNERNITYLRPQKPRRKVKSRVMFSTLDHEDITMLIVIVGFFLMGLVVYLSWLFS